MSALSDLSNRIVPLDAEAMRAASERQERLTKPPGALGRLERLSIQLAGITGRPRPTLIRKAVLTMAGDHGVAAEGVSAYPAEVTQQMVENFLAGGAAINVLARQIGARVVVADLGVAADLPPREGLVDAKIARGTGNMVRGPAMTRAQAERALASGAAIVEAEVAKGLDIVALGDMGIGNSTSAAAIACALTGRPPGEIVGKGTGVDAEGLARKIAAVERALAVNAPDATDGLDVLEKVGGFEIAGLAGATLAAASARIPVVVDGFISTSAAMIAVALCPAVRDRLVASHRSAERGHRIMLDWLNLEPLLDLDLRLGEGTGAALGMFLCDSACRLLDEMATFDEAHVTNRGHAPA